MSEISEERTESSDETEIKYRAEEKVFTESSFSQQSSTSQDSSIQKSSLIQDSVEEVKMAHEESFSETRKESKMEIIESMVEGKMEKMSLDEVTSKVGVFVYISFLITFLKNIGTESKFLLTIYLFSKPSRVQQNRVFKR